jgi:hypothetical protein
MAKLLDPMCVIDVSEMLSAEHRSHGTDVFILGAGFSKAIHGDMPLLKELSAPIVDRLRARGHDPSQVPFINDDVELAMTFLAERHAWLSEAEYLRNRALSLDMAAAIAGEVSSRMQSVLKAHQTCPAPLLRLVHWWHKRRAVIISFNYDTLVERAFSCIDTANGGVFEDHLMPPSFFAPTIAVGSGTTGETASLLKLHGSLNWFYSGRPSYFGEPIHHIHTGGWSPDDSDDSSYEGRVPLVVPPLATKGSYFEHEGIRYLWSAAAKALRSARRIFCIGYSLPGTDLPVRFLFKSNEPRERVPLFLVDTNPNAGVPFQELRLSRINIEGRYIGANALAQTVDALMNEDIRAVTEQAPEHREPGPLQRLMASSLCSGMRLPAFKESESTSPLEWVIVDAISQRGVTCRLGSAEIPTHFTWDALEGITPLIQQSNMERLPIRDLESYLSHWQGWSTARPVITLLQQAQVAAACYEVNAWYVRLTSERCSA